MGHRRLESLLAGVGALDAGLIHARIGARCRPRRRPSVSGPGAGSRLLVVALLALGACSDGTSTGDGARGTVRVGVTFRQAGAGAAAAFDKADNVAVELTAGARTLFSGSVPVAPAGASLEVPLEVTLGGPVQARVQVALRRGPDDLFTGAADVALGPGETARATVVLEAVPDALQLTALPTFTVYGASADLQGAVVFATGDEVPDTPVDWSSLDPGIVRVEAVGGGGYRAVAVADGEARLRATGGALADVLTAVVAAVVASVEVTPSSVDLEPGATATLTALLRDAAGNPIPGRTPAWSSTDDGVATVSATGVVTAVSPGRATVRASRDGVFGSAVVEVRPPGPGVETLSPTGVGATEATFRARVDPAGANTLVAFRYGTAPDLTGASLSASVTVPGSSAPTVVTLPVSGLTDGTTWYVRAEATNPVGDALGEVVSFVTPALPQAPSGLTGQYVGGVELRWDDNSTDEARFEIERELVPQGPNFAPALDGPARVYVPIGQVGPNVTVFVDGPPTGALRYRVRACNDVGCSPWSDPLTWFYGLPPLVTTLAATNVGVDQATLSAFVNPLNAPTIVFWEIDFSASFSEPYVVPVDGLSAGAGNVELLVSVLAESLEAGSTLFVRAVAVNTWGTALGATLSFTTGGGD